MAVSQWCKLVGQVKAIIGDHVDPDATPDASPLTGRALLRPLLSPQAMLPELGSTLPEDVSYVVGEIEIEIVDGRIRYNGQDYVYLLSSVPSIDGGTLHWRIVFSEMVDTVGNKYRPGAVTFDTVPGGEISLSRIQPVPGYEQVGTVKGESAFDIAVANGFAGTVDQWLDSLNKVASVYDRGEYDPALSYVGGDVVKKGGSVYLAVSEKTVVPERRNILPNPRFADNRAGWSTGASVTTTVLNQTVQIRAGADKSKMTSLFLSPAINIQPGDTLSGAATMYNPDAAPVSVILRIDAYSTATNKFIEVTLQPKETKRISVIGHVATGGTSCRLNICSGGMTSGQQVHITQPILEIASTVGGYFDGDTPGAKWEGTPNNSVSILPEQSTMGAVAGEPGVSTSWLALNSPDASEAQSPLGAITPGVPFAVQIYPGDLDKTRSRFLSVEAPILRMSQDDCATWQEVHTFADPVRGVRWLDDGEALVCTKKENNTESYKIWRSTGLSSGAPAQAQWAEVMTGQTIGNNPADGWSWFIDGNICLVADYGKKDASKDQARFVYLSIDMGRTWKQVFELEQTMGLHMHGVAWDKWWNRIWISHGDDQDGIYVSDDLGETWRRVKHGAIPTAPGQVVGIYPLEDCILLASDGVPNGLMRISRSQGRNAESYTLETALEFNQEATITHLCHGIYHAKDIPGAPVLLGYGPETVEGQSRWVATRDGYDAAVIYTDPQTNPKGVGARRCFGPTLRGNIILTSSDSRAGSGRTMWRAPWPDAYLHSTPTA